VAFGARPPLEIDVGARELEHPREPRVPREGVADVVGRRHDFERLFDDVEDAFRSAPAEDGVEAGMRRLHEIVEHRGDCPLERGRSLLEAIDGRDAARDTHAREIDVRERRRVRRRAVTDGERVLAADRLAGHARSAEDERREERREDAIAQGLRIVLCHGSVSPASAEAAECSAVLLAERLPAVAAPGSARTRRGARA
jgi:hypothetical protein